MSWKVKTTLSSISISSFRAKASPKTTSSPTCLLKNTPLEIFCTDLKTLFSLFGLTPYAITGADPDPP